MNTQQLIEQYLDDNYPIVDNTIELDLALYQLQINIISTDSQLAELNRNNVKTLWITTAMDKDIEGTFGVEAKDYFFQWAHKRIGDTITFKLTDGIVKKNIEDGFYKDF